ncbi:hypothetical protein [Blastococcus sp. PRF04-17]|uniref:hypothetical protein n=1 Tax=Blastococcus sp. PRF04-17 TaxID=2933797 RepID=UPI001FF37EA1|nr:hypothetical protein [Blastococcus sp. PRF04-17]UOY03675.1 hypothetical protein MVA48_10225 [Blastococcus sp. PRF04-17]
MANRAESARASAESATAGTSQSDAGRTPTGRASESTPATGRVVAAVATVRSRSTRNRGYGVVPATSPASSSLPS